MNLEKKAEQGVEVKILYDDMGSRGLRKKAYTRFAIKVDMLKHFSHQNYL